MLCAHKSGRKQHPSSAMILALPYDTMVPLLVLCLLSPLLVASVDAAALTCRQGYNVTEAPKECSGASDACVTIKDENRLTNPNTTATTFYTCQKKEDCFSAFTITTGDNTYLRYNSACCTIADCNAGLKWGVPPISLTTNGLVCTTGCFTETKENCKDKRVPCTDAENTCFEATATMETEKGNKTFILNGCGTSNVCGFKNTNMFLNGTRYLLNTSTCKPAKSSSANHIMGKSSFLLLLPSISSILFMKFLS